MGYPEIRLRRLRRQEHLRRLVAETRISVDDLIYPMFVVPGNGIKSEIKSMPENYHFSVDKLAEEVKELERLGINGILLFGVPEKKDIYGSEAYHQDGIIQRAIKAIKDKGCKILVIADVCLCEYTSHGHCGVVKGEDVDNDETLQLLAKVAVSQVQAGADMVAPSDMMDGRVLAIRKALDQEGFTHIPIMSYAAKYASVFYGPFREAADSAPQFGNRKSYQMDPPNVREALREIALDIEEGADIVMVKPALPYLDVISKARELFNVPLAAYQVSGEYSMIHAASAYGWIDLNMAMKETLTAIKRAGADIIITYFAKKFAQQNA